MHATHTSTSGNIRYGDQHGIVMVTVLLLVVTLALAGTLALRATSVDRQTSVHATSAKKAFYVAEAGLEFARAALANMTFDQALAGVDNQTGTTDLDADNGILPFGDSVGFNNGWFKVRVDDNDDGDGDVWNDSDRCVVVTALGQCPNGSRAVIEAVMEEPLSLVTVPLDAVITANTSVRMNGNLTCDGRNHDIDGNLIADDGVKSVSTRSTLTRQGAAKIGGTDPITGNDIEPARSGYDPVVEEVGTWPEIFTPEQALGISEPDFLKGVAQQGVNGSQYVTDPTDLTWPLSGVTYVELPSGATWTPGGSQTFNGSSGILIVHNTSRNAVLKNTNTGLFKGIMIIDDLVHLHNDLLGIIVVLTSAPSDGNVIGNGRGDVLYSTQAISEALASVTSEVTMASWREVF